MRKVTVKQNQNIYDIAAREYGSLDAVGLILLDNAAQLTPVTPLVPGMMLNIRDTPLDAVRQRQIAARNIEPASGDAYRLEEWSVLHSGAINHLRSLSGNLLSVSTNHEGVLVFQNGVAIISFTTSNSDLHSNVVTCTLNQEGVLIGTAASGLIQYLSSTETFSPVVTTSDGLASDNIKGLAKFADEATVVLTDNGISYTPAQLIDGATWTNHLSGVVVYAGIVVNDVLHMATDAGYITWDRSTFSTIDSGDGLPSDDIRSVFVDSRGTVWLGTAADGLVRITSNGNILITDSSGAFAPTDKPRAMAEDANGFLLVGFEDNGTRSYLAVIDTANNWRVLDSNDGVLPQGTITALAVDNRNNVFVGTTSALHHWNRSPILNA